MTESIKIFNVNFGDCFILEAKEGGPAMLVDFGSTRRLDDNVIAAVNCTLYSAPERYLMLTHFHSDHYSGISRLCKNLFFNELYLPDFFSRGIIRLNFALLEFLSERSAVYNFAYNMLNSVPMLASHLDPNGIISFVKRHDVITNSIDRYRILWPDNTKYRNNFYNAGYSDEEADELFGELISYYGTRDLYEMITARADSFSRPILQLINGSERAGAKTLNGGDALVRATNDMRSILLSATAEKTKPIKYLNSSLRRKISAFQNKMCLCFDNASENTVDLDKKVLFLSDITRENFNIIAAGADNMKLCSAYSAIKVPHHGTKDYFVNNLPQSCFMMISNGNAGSGSGWMISALYGMHYSTRGFICTNYENTCDYYLADRQCCASQICCGIASPYYQLEL